jgi:hypothetical protein
MYTCVVFMTKRDGFIGEVYILIELDAIKDLLDIPPSIY